MPSADDFLSIPKNISISVSNLISCLHFIDKLGIIWQRLEMYPPMVKLKSCVTKYEDKQVPLTFFLHRKAVVCCVIDLSIVFTGTRYENIEFWYYNETLYIPVDSSSIHAGRVKHHESRRTVNFKL